MAKKLLFLFFTFFTLNIYAQNVTMTGTVVDVENLPLIGVNVIIKGSTVGTTTDLDGNFSLEGKKGDVLVFSYIGMVSQEIAFKGQPLKIIMKDDSEALDEVVVIGYQSVKKSDLTGAVAVVDAKEMKKSAAGTITSQLQGLATGINVRSTGRAGEDASIEIRGVGSLSDNSPLWIVDGMITNPGVDFNPADIESMQILKDASAAAIYGSRAANGVIIVTTKKGSKGPMKVGVSVKETLEWSPKYDLMNAAEYKKYNDMAYNEAIKNGVGSITSLQQHSDFDTNWQDEVFKTALVQDYNVSLSGGGESGNYYVSAGYYNNDGVSYGNSFNRYSFRVNTTGKRGWFSFGENLAYSLTNKDPLQTNPYNDVMRMMPTIPVYDENNPGGYGYGDAAKYNTFGTNPIARENLEEMEERQNRINGSVWLEFKPFDFLSYKFNGGIDLYFYEKSWFRGEGNWTQNQEHRNPVIDYSLPDPSIIKGEDGYFYLYATEDIRNLPIHRSKDLVNWEFVGTAFTDATRPDFEPEGGIWAPDINKIGDKYVLYYSMSVWGGEWTCGIGCAVADRPEGPFKDCGMMFRSNGIKVQNSIDPFYIEDNGHKYLFWGSFRGIYAIELSEDGLSLKSGSSPVQIAGTAYEGTYIHKRGGYYYMFASIGSCCEGLKSTYTTVVGRSTSLFGPYLDKKGQSMMDNHHEILIHKNDSFVGTGHNSEIVSDNAGTDWLFYHAVSVANPDGRVLMLDKIDWIDGWPSVEGNSPSVKSEKPRF